MFLNGTNIAQIDDQKFNVDHPDLTEVTGTELDGMLAPGGNPLLTFGGLVNPRANTLRFIIADTGDDILDSTVYLSALRASPQVPLPAGVWLLGTGVAGLLGRRLLKKRELPAAEAT